MGADGEGSMDIRSLAAEFEELGTFGRGRHKVRVVRPLTIEVDTPDGEILSSSHGRLAWRVEIQMTADHGQVLLPPSANPLAGLVEKVEFHTHGGFAHVEMRRWAAAAEIETRTLSNTSRGTLSFVDTSTGGEPVGVGLAMDVDGLAVDVRVPDGLITAGALSDKHLRGIRVEYWRHLLVESQGTRRLLGRFDTERLADAVLLVVIEEAIAQGGTLESAYGALRGGDRLTDAVTGALRRHSGNGDNDQPQRVSAIVKGLAEPAIMDALERTLPVLWQDPDPDLDAWAAQRLAATVGAAFHRALQDLCPEYDADDLTVDIDPGSGDREIRVWLCEQTIGGGGILQEALTRIGDRPRRFFDLVAAAAEPAVGEMVDAELTRVATEVASATPIAEAIERVRGAQVHADRTEAFDVLLTALQTAGVFVSHPVVSALSVRWLRPGATTQIDRTVAGLIARWDELQQTLDADIDLRLFAEVHSRTSAFDQSSGLAAPAEDPVGWRAGQIAGLLWQRGAAVRAQALQAPNPFSALPDPDPVLMRSCLAARAAPTAVEHLDAVLASDGPLASDGDAEIEGSSVEASTLRKALLRAAASPIEAGPLLHYPRVESVRRTPNAIRARLVLDLVGE
jgi:hypothetical protein